ncbi:heparinase II/III domain-containing protein [Mucilaginibacter boryungensis]|uniref:Heparinase II/III family protein n=1 Tax=Mucilaginibacter boryungensis TaxID=768480 RepID=A0ABR9XFX9_9SPHI|nr:heparinase II/III family protein [Mucilaginibacter boryungensis]MBE9666306.1 heparinase II/III family protein [Mucilaginibacter boryungensis]
MKTTAIITASLLLLTISLRAQITPRNLLQKFSQQQVGEWLIPQSKWKPFPQSAAEWRRQLPDSVIRKIIANGETALKKPFNNIPASVTLEFVRSGNRSDYEALSFAKRNQLFDLVLAETLEDKGRFTDHIADGVWSICEETFWGATAHLGAQKAGPGLPDVQDPIVELFSGETACILGWADYFVGPKLEKVSKLIRPRIYYEVNRRIFTPMLTAKYGWAGGNNPQAKLNNWAPWIMANYTAANLLLEKDETKRAHALEIAMKITDQYINGLGEDGGCDEGPSYWFAAGGAVFDVLNLLSDATDNKLNIYNDPFTKKMASYIYKTHIAGRYFINVADAHPEMTPDGVMLHRFGKAINDPKLADFGDWSFNALEHREIKTEGFHRSRALYNLFALSGMTGNGSKFTDVPDVWFNDVQLMASRTNNGLFVASHAGNNGESHNHNDVGDFVVYADGYPVIIDVGSGTYTARTFGKDRYSLWFNTSPYHNLPAINGLQQSAGIKYAASDVKYSLNGTTAKLAMDIKPAYPSNTGINSLQRTVTVNKAGKIEIDDNFSTSTPIQTLTQSFMTVCPVDISQSGKIIFDLPNGKKVTLDYNAKLWGIKKEKMELTTPEDQGLKSSWEHHDIYRVLLTAKSPVNDAIVTYIIHK